MLCDVIEREYLLKDGYDFRTGTRGDGPMQLAPHVRKILTIFSEEVDGKLPYRTVVYSCPKKSAKTEMSAAFAYAFARVYGGLILSIANDKEQAGRTFARVKRMLRLLPKSRYDELIENETVDEIVFRENDAPNGQAILRSIPCDPAGEAGHENLALTCWDELWGYKGDLLRTLWSELQPVPNIPYSMRMVTTYAGYYGVSDVLWDLYEGACKPDPDTQEETGAICELPIYVEGSLCVYWDHQCRMPWQTAAFLAEAKDDPAVKRNPTEYARLWENRWQTGLENFLPKDLIERLMAEGARQGLKNAYP